MPHIHRFFVEPDSVQHDEVVLAGQEGHHALHVARVKVGDSVELFDGQGARMTGAVSRVSRHDACVKVEQVERVPEPGLRLSIVQAWLNHEKSIDSLVRRGTELGVAKFVFFKGEHSERAPKVSDKLKRVAIESCKQSRRAWLPTFHIASSLTDALAEEYDAALIAVCHTEATPLRVTLSKINPEGSKVAIIVGPEGDFSDDEVETAITKGAKPISLGDVTYRSEVAATVAVSLILYELGELGPLGG